jgi:CRISPR/Cas system-associated protein Cas10 (large subunit of type III CRISPR-Cas system)
MENVKYLYGASVQGIQDFIFQTNKLKEIVGASELVEQICTTERDGLFNEFGVKEDSIVRAAGNIRHVFKNTEDCEKAVLKFPKKVMATAPGITISQAVVTLKADLSDYEEKANELENRLRIQRNKPVRSMTLGLTAIHRAPSTGLPAVEEHGEDGMIDEASKKKIDQHQATRKLVEKSFGKSFGKSLSQKEIAYDIEDITGKNDWIAIIHADGNGMGAIFREVGKDKDKMKEFSEQVSSITEAAAQKAFQSVEDKYKWEKIIPIRPVVLGGDDLTLICRADLAVDYTKTFLEAFEDFEEEAKKQSDKNLTACAGIAFVKSSYPFHYAVNLAESLCKRAKDKARTINKDLPPSCLMFHKVQDSFVEDFEKIIERELTPQENLSFEFGPYYCKEQERRKGTSIKDLMENIDLLKKNNAIKSHLRQWLSTLFDNVGAADQMMKRLKIIHEKETSFIEEKFFNLSGKMKTEKIKIPYYDILSLASILFTETKK